MVWKTIALPEQVTQKIEKVLRKGGYASLNEFVRDACRRRLEEIAKKSVEAPAA
jgi:Arc/MetJ-type ribon-helix-helix transcriptional regulator